MEDETEVKQNYLREEIIEKGYDPEIFSKYIIELKGEDGFDLENWTMEELVYIVNDFRRKYNEAKEENIKSSISEEEQGIENSNIDNKPQSFSQSNFFQEDTNLKEENQDLCQQNNHQEPTNTKPEKISIEEAVTTGASPELPLPNNDKYQSSHYNSFIYSKVNPLVEMTEVVICNKQDKTILTDISKLSVIISNPELIKNGIFSFAYLQYTITTKEINKVVTRKIADFEWFYNKLIELFPGVCIPFFPMKKIFEKKNDNTFQSKMYYIQKFFNAIIKTKVIRSSKFLLNFISLPKEEWKTVRLSLEKTPGPLNMSQFTTMEGIINIHITKDLDLKAGVIQKDIYAKSAVHTRLTAALRNVMMQMTVMSDYFHELSESYNALSQVYNDSIFKNDYLCKGYKKLGTLIRDWSDGYKKQRHFFKLELKDYFKFMQKELHCFSPIVDEYKQARSKYFDYHNKTCRIPFMNNQQFTELTSLKKYYGFFMNRSINEYYRLQKNHMKRLKIHFDTMTDRQLDFIVDYMSFIKLLSFNF